MDIYWNILTMHGHMNVKLYITLFRAQPEDVSGPLIQ